MRIFLLATILLLSGPSWAISDSGKTVADNRSISKAIREKMAPGMAEAILSAEYDGFYQISGKQKRDDSFKFSRVKSKKSFPDDRWEQLAVEVAARVNYKGESKNVGRRTKLNATAYVVFYKEGIEGVDRTNDGESLALVMIDQKNKASINMPSANGISGKRIYLLSVAM